MAHQIRWTLITSLLLSTASLSTCASVDLTKIHEHMTKDELSMTFNVKDRATVPIYEVVPIVYQTNHPHRHRRSVQPGHHVVTIKELTLYLEPVDHVLIGEGTPVYLASANKSYPNGIRYEQVENVWPKSLSMYQDPKNNAAVVMYKESDGKVNIEGLIGNDTVVKPVPSRFKNSTSIHSHIVYKKESFNNSLSYENYLNMSSWSKRSQALQIISKLEQDVVYPEILAIIDYSTYLAHGKNLQALCKYMAAFWNAVDLRFRSITLPAVRLNIAGLIVSIEEDGAPYMTKYRAFDDQLVDVGTLAEIGKYLYQEERFAKSTYDVAVSITNLDLCTLDLESAKVECSSSVLGLSRSGGACMQEKNPMDYGVSVMEDHAGFDGVLTAAHEIAHLLGVDHDMPFDTDFKQCHTDFGFLMSPVLTRSTNAILWSECSRLMMSSFLRTGAECLRNKPEVKKPIAKILPGQLMSRNEQCSHKEGMVECEEHGEDECRMLYCRKPSSWLSWLTQLWSDNKCVLTMPPVEGSPCSGGGMCLDGVCIHENNEV